jgi:hypothetical protein
VITLVFSDCLDALYKGRTQNTTPFAGLGRKLLDLGEFLGFGAVVGWVHWGPVEADSPKGNDRKKAPARVKARATAKATASPSTALRSAQDDRFLEIADSDKGAFPLGKDG